VITLTSLVVGDDHKVFLDALSVVLGQQDFTVTVARSARETVDAVSRLRPDVCLIDRHFAGEDGLSAIEEMTAAAPATKVLVLSADPETGGILRALSAGASGYLHKTRGVTALTAAIRRVQRGEVAVDVPKAPAPRRPAQQDAARRLASFLTGRERECLGLLVEGLDTSGMAARLGVSRATVRTHVQSLLMKLGVHSRLEAASFAVRYRLLDDAGGPAARRALPAAALLPATSLLAAAAGLRPRRRRASRAAAHPSAAVPARASAATIHRARIAGMSGGAALKW
jgi:two-component system, NarL family, nitrate/nitrite response regulator NarL